MLLCVAESCSFSLNCGAHAEYAYWRILAFIADSASPTHIGSASQRDGCGSDDG